MTKPDQHGQRFSVLTRIISRFNIWVEFRETVMVRPVLVRPLPNYHIYLEFSDGAKGEVDLSDLVGKGVFQICNDYSLFQRVYVGSERRIQWEDYVELCPDSLYLKLTGKTPEELFPILRRDQPHA